MARATQLSDDVVLNGECHGLGATLDTEFAQNAAHVEFDGRPADDEPLGNIRIVQPLHHERQNFSLARAEIVAARLRLNGALNERLRGLGCERRLS